jgi:hypothetical protein
VAPANQLVLSNKAENAYVGRDSVIPDNNSSWLPLKPNLGVRAFFDVIVQKIQENVFERFRLEQASAETEINSPDSSFFNPTIRRVNWRLT